MLEMENFEITFTAHADIQGFLDFSSVAKWFIACIAD